LSEDRLDSWKEIAGYLNRDVSTVQRWEKREAMPVHRHLHDKLGSVHAFKSELDRWVAQRVRASANEDLTADSSAARVMSGHPGTEPIAAEPPAVASTRRRAVPWRSMVIVALLVSAVVAWTLRADSRWRNPLLDARFQHLTDFPGTEQAAAISRDGRFVAFLADRSGVIDLWLTQVGTGQFHNLTRGTLPDLVNSDIRTLGFSPDATAVSLWVRRPGAAGTPDIGVWALPTLGGEPRPYLEGAAEYDWSPDGVRLVYHTTGPGDPMFVKDRANQQPRRIWVAPSGWHAHFPVWSPDAQWIFFVYGTLPNTLDIWRIAATGGSPERVTFHNARVTHPTFVSSRTLLYLATDEHGGGPWIYGLDLRDRTPRRLSTGVERYTSLAASDQGARVVATIASRTGTLWRMPIGEAVADQSSATRVTLPTTRGRSPRYGPNYLLYVSARGADEGIWKLVDGNATELWSAAGARILGAPAIAPNGQWIAFCAEDTHGARLYTIKADGSGLRRVSESVQPRGAPAWSPDGRSIAVATMVNGEPRLAIMSADRGVVSSMVDDYSQDPTWSPDGTWLLFSGPDIGTTFQVHAISADGRPYPFKPLTLSRGARRLAFAQNGRVLVILRGEVNHRNIALIDLETGAERTVTNFANDFVIQDFDVSPDGREIVFDQTQEHSDLVLIDFK
jgi:Tol biopolymer transport system component